MAGKTALFDMDGTLADHDKAMLQDLRLIQEPGPDILDLVPNKNLHSDDIPDYIIRRIKMIRSVPGWWRNLDTMPIGFEVMRIAREIGFEIHVLTQGPLSHPAAWKEKIEWCQDYLPDDVKITITRDKGLVYGRVLVDDFSDYMIQWLAHRPRGLGIMPIASQNKDFEHPNVIHANDFNYILVREKLQEAFDREEGKPYIRNEDS